MIDFSKMRQKLDDAITYDDPSKAIALAREGLEAAEKEEALAERMYFSAQLLMMEEEFEEAIKFLDRAIKYNPKDGAAYNDRALCMIELGQLDDALMFFNRGIEVEPDFATIHHNKGWFLNQLGRQAEALECFYRALELDAKRAVTYENLADCLYKSGKTAEAIEAYQQSISLLSERCVDIRNELTRLINTLKKKSDKTDSGDKSAK